MEGLKENLIVAFIGIFVTGKVGGFFSGVYQSLFYELRFHVFSSFFNQALNLFTDCGSFTFYRNQRLVIICLIIICLTPPPLFTQ